MEIFFSLAHEKIVLIAPPSLVRGAWITEERLIAASRELAGCYQGISERLGCRFADAGQWNIPLAYDGVHFTETGNRTFADAICALLCDE